METQQKHPDTKFKSAYYLGDKLLSFFLNFRQESQSFSFIIKKGAYSFIYNLTSEEKLLVIRTMLRELSREELERVTLEAKLDLEAGGK